MDDKAAPFSLQFGAVTLIPGERLALKDGRPLSLTPKAFDLLAVLAENAGRLLTKEELMQALWPDTAVEESNLNYHVFAIRKALGENPDGDRYVETVPKRGYRFVASVTRVDGERRAGVTSASPGDATSEPAIARTAVVTWRWLGSALALALVLVLASSFGRRSLPVNTPGHFIEPVMGRLAESGMFSVSPDGRQLVYAAEGPDGVLRLWRRALSTLQPVALPGTEIVAIAPPVIWSPDSRFVAFDVAGTVKIVSLDGGTPQTVCKVPAIAVGGSWNEEQQILLGSAAGGLLMCPAAGGRPVVVTEPRDPDERHIFPAFLSDGRRFIYLRISRTRPETSGIYVGELGAAAPPSTDRLITTGFGAAFVPATDSNAALIVFARDGKLFAQRFDEGRLRLLGDPLPLADRIGSYIDGAFFAASVTTLVYRAPEPQFQLTWFDRHGRELDRIGAPARFSDLALSPAGDRIVVAMHAPQGTTSQDVWFFDLSGSATPRPLTFGPELATGLVWISNDRFVVGSGGGMSGVYQHDIGGQRQLLFRTARGERPSSATPDGRILIFGTLSDSGTESDVWVRSASGASASVKPLLQMEKAQGQARISPDRRWLAYVSNETGPNQVFIVELRVDGASVTTAGGRVKISDGGGFGPRWSADGRELIYLTPDGSVISIRADAQGKFRPSTASHLFNVPGVLPQWGLTRDGARFLFAVPASEIPGFHVVRDWQAGLAKP